MKSRGSTTTPLILARLQILALWFVCFCGLSNAAIISQQQQHTDESDTSLPMRLRRSARHRLLPDLGDHFKEVDEQNAAPYDGTHSPTASPTVTPTIGPTSSPTVSPTKSPTTSPTVSPTQSPSLSPATQDEEANTQAVAEPEENSVSVSDDDDSFIAIAAMAMGGTLFVLIGGWMIRRQRLKQGEANKATKSTMDLDADSQMGHTAGAMTVTPRKPVVPMEFPHDGDLVSDLGNDDPQDDLTLDQTQEEAIDLTADHEDFEPEDFEPDFDQDAEY